MMQMKHAFLLQPTKKHISVMINGDVDGRFAFALPGIACPKCGSWAATGYEYPAIDATPLLAELGQIDIWPLARADFLKLKKKVMKLVPKGTILLPGTHIGPMTVTLKKPILSSFLWLTPYTPLCTLSAFQKMADSGLPIVAARVAVESRYANDDPLMQVFVPPSAHLASNLVPAPCPVCGRLDFELPEPIVLQSSAFDESTPFQRIMEAPTQIVVNNRAARILRKLFPSDVSVSKVGFA